MSIAIEELDADTLKKLGLEIPAPTRKRNGMTKEAVRQYAIRALATLDKLSQSDRKRVLKHALEVNEV
jgi:hypothetical protein